MRRLALAAATLLPLTACASDPQERIVKARFDCAGERLDVAFNQTREVAVVRLTRKETVELPSLHPAGGMRFEGSGYVLRGAGDTLTFSGPGRPAKTCTQVR